MQSRHTTRDDYVMESLRQASPMLRNMARRYAHEYDDLYQTAAETVLRAYDKAQATSDSRAYLHRTIRNTILDYVRATSPDHRAHTLADHYRIESFDAPCGSDSSLSLYDLVGEVTPAAQSSRNFSRLYTLIDALPEIYRTVICMRFGLAGHGVHQPYEVARILGISQYSERKRFYRGLAMLREYAELRDLVERHKPSEE